MSQQASVLGYVKDVPSTTTLTPRYRGISSALARNKAEEARYRAAVTKAPHLASDDAHQQANPRIQDDPSTEQAVGVDAAYASRDIEQLRWAIYHHLMTNPELAEVVSSEALRSLPWLPCDNPLKPYDGRVPFSWFINMKAKSRYRDQQRKLWARQSDVALDSYQRERALYDVVGESNNIDGHGELREFLATLPAKDRELAEECLSKRKQQAGFMALVHRAKEWAKSADTVTAPTGCHCFSCLPRPWALDALRSVDDLGCLPATYRLLESLPARRPRPAGWQLESIRTPRFTDRWASKGRSHTKPASTNPDDWEPIPANLYNQVMGSSE